MIASSQRENSDEDDQNLRRACAKVRKESVILREDAREYRDIAEHTRIQSAALRSRAAALLKNVISEQLQRP